MHMSYWRFAAMIATSTVVMFGLMYLNTYALEHVLWSETRAWMALLMGASMAVIMLSFMLGMYRNKAVNIAIFAGSVVVFGLSLWLVRSQATVSGVEYMKAMVPHHSIAIMTSERAQITDPRVRKLADEIIEAQRREISEMQYLIHDLEALEGNPAPGEGMEQSLARPPLPEVVSGREAVQSPDPTTIDPETLDEAEIEKVIGPAPRCDFAYSLASRPILAAAVQREGNAAVGVIKIHGRVVEVRAEAAHSLQQLAEGAAFTAEGIRLAVVPVSEDDGEGIEERRAANLRFELDQGLQVDYRGWYGCG